MNTGEEDGPFFLLIESHRRDQSCCFSSLRQFTYFNKDVRQLKTVGIIWWIGSDNHGPSYLLCCPGPHWGWSKAERVMLSNGAALEDLLSQVCYRDYSFNRLALSPPLLYVFNMCSIDVQDKPQRWFYSYIYLNSKFLFYIIGICLEIWIFISSETVLSSRVFISIGYNGVLGF